MNIFVMCKRIIDSVLNTDASFMVDIKRLENGTNFLESKLR